MPTLRGERFHIPLDDQDVAPDENAGNNSTGFAATGVLGDILERASAEAVAPLAPSALAKRYNNGWPSHKKRYTKSKAATKSTSPQQPDDSHMAKEQHTESNLEQERREIDIENSRRLKAMSDEEIEQERQELYATFSPDLLKGLINRRRMDSATHAKEEAIPSRPPIEERKVSFAVPPDLENHSPTRRDNAKKHYVPSSSSPSGATFPDFKQPPSARPSAGRKVSFSVPEHEDLRQTSTATSHSVPPTPTSVVEGLAIRPESPESRRPSQPARKVSFSVPESSDAPKTATSASSHSIPGSHSLTGTISNRIDDPPQRPSVSNRKVSFSLPNDDLDARHSSAVSHNIARSESCYESETSSSASASCRPSQTERKVSFATPSDDDDNDDSRSTASHHSVPSTPQFRPEPIVDIASDDIHFPRPNQPDLDPESDSFLEDLHQKYFPTLAHDPSKLDWMKPVDPRESAAYDPSVVDEVHPKDIRFDFHGQIIPPSKSRSLPTNLGLHNHAAAPEAAGYTIAELAHLARSSYAPQRCIAMQTLGRVLFRLGSGEFGREEHILRKDASGQRALLAKGFWQEVEQGHAIESISEEARKERGHQTSIAIAQEALWNWQRGGGSKRARAAQ